MLRVNVRWRHNHIDTYTCHVTGRSRSWMAVSVMYLCMYLRCQSEFKLRCKLFCLFLANHYSLFLLLSLTPSLARHSSSTYVCECGVQCSVHVCSVHMCGVHVWVCVVCMCEYVHVWCVYAYVWENGVHVCSVVCERIWCECACVWCECACVWCEGVCV